MSGFDPDQYLASAKPKGGFDPDAYLQTVKPEKPGIAEDVAKSAGTGAVKGAIGMIGAGGDLRNLASSATDYLANKLGASPETAQKIKDAASFGIKMTPARLLADAPTSADIQGGLESVTGPLHKPQTTAGEYAQTVGEFAPALLGGGEGLLARAGKQVLLPAIASETAGQATKGTAAEPYARIAAGILGGLAPALRRAPEVAAPTVEELKDAARAQYQHPDVTAVQINPQSVAGLSAKIESDLANQGFRPSTASAPSTFDEVRNLVPPQGVSGVKVADLDSSRRALGHYAKQVDAYGQPTAEAAAAKIAIKHIDDYLPNLKQPDLLAGDAARATQILDEARGNWGAAKRAEQINTLADNAKIQAASTYGGGNINNATRQALRPLLKNNGAKARGFNDSEMEALSNAVEGSWLGNTLRQVGKLGPDTGLKGLEHIAAAIGSGGTSIPLSATALGARILGDRSTRKAVERLEEQLRSRSPLHQATLAARNNPMLPSATTPSVMYNNPNYVSPSQSNRVPSTLANILLSAQSANTQ